MSPSHNRNTPPSRPVFHAAALSVFLSDERCWMFGLLRSIRLPGLMAIGLPFIGGISFNLTLRWGKQTPNPVHPWSPHNPS